MTTRDSSVTDGFCDAAVELAAGAADLVVCGSTFVTDETHLADEFFHLTARQAATIALPPRE